LSRALRRAYLPGSLLAAPDCLLHHHALVVEQADASAAPIVLDLLPAGELPEDLPRLSLPEEVWTAAPVLAHAHLESWDAPSAAWPRDSFTAWVRALMTWREQPRLSAAASAAHSLSALAEGGVGLVASHVGEPEALPAPAGEWWQQQDSAALPEPRHWPSVMAWQEWIGQAAMPLPKPWPGCQGFALHAPYSVPHEAAQRLFQAASLQPVSIHLGEHQEERAFLADGSGPMATFVQERGGQLPADRFSSPVAWLEAAGGLRPGVLAVHGGDLSAEELQQLAAAGVSLVFCPGTHEYFDRSTPAFLKAGIPLPALGCDSMASNRRLDPLEELRLVCRLLPEVGAQAWWHALTIRGAEVLQAPGYGHLQTGAQARVMRLRQVPTEALQEAASLCAFLASGEAQGVERSSLPPC